MLYGVRSQHRVKVKGGERLGIAVMLALTKLKLH